MGPCPHMRFCALRQERHYDQNYIFSMGPRPHLWSFCIKSSDFSTRIASRYGCQPSSVVFACKTATFGSELLVSMGPRLRLKFFAIKTATLVPELQVSMVPALICVFCIQNSAISIRNTSLYGSLPSYAVFACETATLGPELQVSMGPRPHLWCFVLKSSDFSTRIASLYGFQPIICRFLHAKQRLIWIRITSLYGSQTAPLVLCMQNKVISISLYGSQPSFVAFAFKTATLVPELQVSIGSSPHLCFFAIKTAPLSTRITILYGSHSSLVVLCMKKRLISNRITSFYGSQTSPVVLCMQYSVISIRNNCLFGSQPSFVVLACKTATFGSELQVSMGRRPHLSFLCNAKQRLISIKNY